MSAPSLFRSQRQCMASTQSGLTLIELMISITLGLLVVAAATALLLSSKAAYITQDEASILQENGRFAIDSITRAIRQAAYENWDSTEAPIIAIETVGPNLNGLDARSLKEAPAGIDAPVAKAVNGSDVLAIRFFGSGSGTNGDGSMINCAGFGVAAPASQASADGARGWSIFYVADDSSGEPELRCKYRGKSGWASDAIVRGVESFQVLYGLDTDGDSLPNRFVNATTIEALDDALILEGENEAEKALDRNRKTHWKKIAAIKIALLVHGSQNARSDVLKNRYDLFGADYTNASGASDVGATIIEADISPSVRRRMRSIFASTIQLRNQAAGSRL